MCDHQYIWTQELRIWSATETYLYAADTFSNEIVPVFGQVIGGSSIVVVSSCGVSWANLRIRDTDPREVSKPVQEDKTPLIIVLNEIFRDT